ncbi:MAG: IS4 family transposase [Clostridiales bacterium]|nr:IS4 family transposase [Clostridiales bacterium]
MNDYPQIVKRKLDHCIQKLVWNRERFVNNPDKDFIRSRKMPLKRLISILITMGPGSQNKELLEFFKFDVALPTASALIQQRNKLKPTALLFVLQEFTKSLKKIKRYRGYRLLAIDGSKVPIYRDPNDADTFAILNQYSEGCNFLHVNALYDICNKLYLDTTIQAYKGFNEVRALVEMIKRSPLSKKVIIVADRGYEAYNNLAHLQQKGWNYVIRVKACDVCKGILSKTELPVGEEFDEVVSILMTRRQTKEIRSNPKLYRFLTKKSTFDFLPVGSKDTYSLTFRVVCVKINEDKYQYLLTNLDSSFTSEDLKYLYHKRWGIEISFRELKHTIGLMHFNSKKVEHIKQEIYAKMILYNFCEMITLDVVIKQDRNRKYSYQANFTIAMTICIKFLRCFNDKHPPNVEALIRKYIYPVREGRNFFRDIKVKQCKGFLYRVA